MSWFSLFIPLLFTLLCLVTILPAMDVISVDSWESIPEGCKKWNWGEILLFISQDLGIYKNLAPQDFCLNMR